MKILRDLNWPRFHISRSAWMLLSLGACSGTVLYSQEYLDARKGKAAASGSVVPEQKMVFTFDPDASLGVDDAFAYLFPGKTIDAFQSANSGPQFTADITIHTERSRPETNETDISMTMDLSVPNAQGALVRQGFSDEGGVVLKCTGLEDVMQGTLRDQNGHGKVLNIYATRKAEPNVTYESESWVKTHPWMNGSLRVDPQGPVLGRLQGYVHYR